LSALHPLANPIIAVARAISGVQVRGMNRCRETKQRIYFANHTSHLDFVVIWSALTEEARTRTHPVAAREFWETGLRGYLAQNVFRAVLIQRSTHPRGDHSAGSIAQARAVVDQLAETMGDTESLIIFPEGMRSTDNTTAPFRSGLYYLAQSKPGVELIPVYLENLGRVLPKGEILPVPLLSRLTFGEPLQLGEDESKDAFLARARAAVLGLRERSTHGSSLDGL
jgi:1-acyl-sn-glycerol-3-phosphate acyltransferase